MCGVVLVTELRGRGVAGSRRILPLALAALARLGHRGAVDADGRTGDGAGILTAIPFELLASELDGMGDREVAVGMFFLPREKEAAVRARRDVARAVAAHELLAMGWRAVPVDPSALGAKARASQPRIEQLFVIPRITMTPDELEASLVRARADIEAQGGPYVVSLSHRTIVYKALVQATDLAAFYPDLRNPDYTTSFAIAHQRFSTNTFPSWEMAQPFRLLAHNGEINTIAGNRQWLRARGVAVPDGESDSASLDRAASHLGADDLPAAMKTLLAGPEPWEGPALVAFSDGRVAGAALDRNGLRPARYVVSEEGLIALASEAGVFDVEGRQERLGPGEMIVVDLDSGGRTLCAPTGLRGRGAQRAPLTIDIVRTEAEKQAPFVTRSKERNLPSDAHVLRAFGYTRDEVQVVLAPMYKEGIEPIASMGDDTPLAILSARPRLLFSYFKQRFAQVTNPSIDPLREALVMSLETRLGDVLLPTPLLRRTEVRALLSWQGWSARKLSLLFESPGGRMLCAPTGRGAQRAPARAALDSLLAESARAVREGVACLVLSDRGVDAEHAAIPSLLAVSAVHQHLVREGLRPRTSLVAEAGDARDDHHVAALIGFGADAVCPHLALQMISGIVRQESGSHEEAEQARWRYRRALTKGLLKILSKMGVSTIRSYRGAQLFEAVGIGKALIDAHFTGTPSLIGGIGLAEIERDVLRRHAEGFAKETLDDAGLYRFRNGGEAHAYEPRVVKALHRGELGAVRSREPIVLRDLLDFRPAATPAPLGSVEPAQSIARRFMSAAMSLGALSPEAQEALAVAMNRLGARSNSGEGGELAAPRSASHRIKQVASARFGVTAAYLANADELQIKIAQGSKPGEGGQLPGDKVTPLIARVRHATPGTPLISPPPHHDIYSIEDLAQLIADLKQVNPAATVSVKLVSSAGIGTIAVGVAKAHADAIEISGHDGGTGASPIGSIRNAGTPWELGLAEAHQGLVRAGLRDRVRLQVNGGLKSGRDVVVAALLGAEEFGFGTAALVSLGCAMARQCHLNTCPTGIATQREELRAKFRGTPDDVIRFFTAVAEDVREILARLGLTELRAAIGRGDLLQATSSIVSFDSILQRAAWSRGDVVRNDPPSPANALDAQIISRRLRVATLPITNADRAVGAGIAGHLARHGKRTVRVAFRGAAGQSFGAFCVDGMRLELRGVANDGVGKGMSGGEIVLRASRAAGAVLAGNAVLYGATGGRLFIGGRAGERFAVRNSGATAVVEGTGDHACEYMTAGVVVILGTTGLNAGAGMTGGTLFALDEPAINGDSVVALDLSPDDEALLHELLVAHREATGSPRAQELLDAWPRSLARFCRVVPIAASTQQAEEDVVVSR